MILRSLYRTRADEVLLLAVQAGRDKMLKHYIKNNWIYCVVLILDPRHKVESFDLSDWGKALKKESYKKFIDIFSKEYCEQENINLIEDREKEIESQKKETGIDFNILYAKKKSCVLETWDKELKSYLDSPRTDEETDILDWWRTNEKIYPRLAKMARDFLSIMPTAVPSERLFSSAGLILTPLRTNLSDISLKSLLCICSWMLSSLKSNIYECDI